jgi:protein-S-isoprenylcysteine O-methyltransferase Ste14
MKVLVTAVSASLFFIGVATQIYDRLLPENSWYLLVSMSIAAVFATDVGEYAGLAQLHPGWRPDRKEPMRLSGLYCLVRHPIYFFSLPLIWFSPQLTLNHLTIAILFTLYFYFGAMHEETGLRAEFGPPYDDYQAQVPMLIPRLRRCPDLQQVIARQ